MWLSDSREMAAGRRGRGDRGLHGRRRAIGLTLAIKERHLADRFSDRRVLGGARECVATTQRGPERRDPVGIDARQRAGVCDRRAPVLQLQRRVDVVGFPGAVAEAAMIEDEGRNAGLGEPLGERPEPIAARPGQAVGHHDQREGVVGSPASGRVQPRSTGVGCADEGHFRASHVGSTAGSVPREV